MKFGAPTTTVNKTIHVTDSYAGALGTVTATEPPRRWRHTRSPTSGRSTFRQTVARTYDNTATITETGAHDSQSVRVCGPVQTGALTIGFWQNKNGQAIITGGASVAGVCKSGTWLRTYAPFQDLSATATCNQVATYVTNIIKAANASGAAMNAMLKAQMLATALDVYFSDPALGTNKIGAPAPIGGVAIDLTNVCANPLGCSKYINASTAFGGATSLTVSQILAYAASQSNSGGTRGMDRSRRHKNSPRTCSTQSTTRLHSAPSRKHDNVIGARGNAGPIRVRNQFTATVSSRPV